MEGFRIWPAVPEKSITIRFGYTDIYAEPVRPEPPRDRVEVLLRYAKLLPELLRREPFVEVRRTWDLDLLENRSQRSSLAPERAATEAACAPSQSRP